MGDHGMAYAPQADDEPEAIGGAGGGLPGGALDDHVQRRFLRAGRILVTGGWLVLINTTIGNRGTNSEHTIVGLTLLILGVFLIVLSPVANQFPGAARAGAAVADAVLFYFFAPGN
ncbi:unnamed protein product [Urochloa decumbens]|uniref:Integral membrane protein n=1 Tax=Urochloa decumbens TaxID=240449 RepID=A0ABC9DIX5_9POAL